jgi:hypothetical protein
MPFAFDCPSESLPRGCDRCESAVAEIDGHCPTCAISNAADNDDFERCFAIAEDFGIENVIVGRLIASSAAYRARAEGINAQRALLDRLTGRTAVVGLLAGLRIESANDVAVTEVSK